MCETCRMFIRQMHSWKMRVTSYCWDSLWFKNPNLRFGFFLLKIWLFVKWWLCITPECLLNKVSTPFSDWANRACLNAIRPDFSAGYKKLFASCISCQTLLKFRIPLIFYINFSCHHQKMDCHAIATRMKIWSVNCESCCRQKPCSPTKKIYARSSATGYRSIAVFPWL